MELRTLKQLLDLDYAVAFFIDGNIQSLRGLGKLSPKTILEVLNKFNTVEVSFRDDKMVNVGGLVLTKTIDNDKLEVMCAHEHTPDDILKIVGLLDRPLTFKLKPLVWRLPKKDLVDERHLFDEYGEPMCEMAQAINHMYRIWFASEIVVTWQDQVNDTGGSKQGGFETVTQAKEWVENTHYLAQIKQWIVEDK